MGSKTTIFDTDSEEWRAEMADVNKFTDQLAIDSAGHFADMNDAAHGKGNRKGVGARWLRSSRSWCGPLRARDKRFIHTQNQEGHEPGQGASF